MNSKNHPMQNANKIRHFQEIYNIILSIKKPSSKRIEWIQFPNHCAKIAKIILENDLDPQEIHSYCVLNGLKTSVNGFYNFPRGYQVHKNCTWNALVLEMFNLNIEPYEKFRTIDHHSANLSKPTKIITKEIVVNFPIGSKVYNLVQDKIRKQLT